MAKFCLRLIESPDVRSSEKVKISIPPFSS